MGRFIFTCAKKDNEIKIITNSSRRHQDVARYHLDIKMNKYLNYLESILLVEIVLLYLK